MKAWKFKQFLKNQLNRHSDSIKFAYNLCTPFHIFQTIFRLQWYLMICKLMTKLLHWAKKDNLKYAIYVYIYNVYACIEMRVHFVVQVGFELLCSYKLSTPASWIVTALNVWMYIQFEHFLFYVFLLFLFFERKEEHLVMTWSSQPCSCLDLSRVFNLLLAAYRKLTL